jgi:hypothetical protein
LHFHDTLEIKIVVYFFGSEAYGEDSSVGN